MARGTLLVYLTLSTDYLITNYFSNQTVNDFDLRRSFYSRQSLKNIYCSPAYIGHKGTLQHRASTQKVTSMLL